MGSAPIEQELPEKKILSKKSLSEFDAVKVMRTVELEPGSEQLVPVTCNHQGLRIIESLQKIWDKKKVIVASGVARVRPLCPFEVKIANFSRHRITLYANKNVGTSHSVPIPATEEEVAAAIEEQLQLEGQFDPSQVKGTFRNI